MSLTVRKFSAQVRDSTTGEMIPAGLLSSDALGAINTAKNTAVAAVQAQGATTIASIPSDYTSLSNEVDDLKSAIKTIRFSPLICNADGYAVVDSTAHTITMPSFAVIYDYLNGVPVEYNISNKSVEIPATHVSRLLLYYNTTTENIELVRSNGYWSISGFNPIIAVIQFAGANSYDISVIEGPLRLHYQQTQTWREGIDSKLLDTKEKLRFSPLITNVDGYAILDSTTHTITMPSFAVIYDWVDGVPVEYTISNKSVTIPATHISRLLLIYNTTSQNIELVRNNAYWSLPGFNPIIGIVQFAGANSYDISVLEGPLRLKYEETETWRNAINSSVLIENHFVENQLTPAKSSRYYAAKGLMWEYYWNTIPAFEAALSKKYISGVSVDVQVTSDGKFVCFHDGTVDNDTDGTGTINSKTLAQVQALNITKGVWDVTNATWKGMDGGITGKIPEFIDVLKVVRKWGKTLNIEFKYSGGTAALEHITSAKIDELVTIIKNLGMVNSVSISALNSIANYFAQKYPEFYQFALLDASYNETMVNTALNRSVNCGVAAYASNIAADPTLTSSIRARNRFVWGYAPRSSDTSYIQIMLDANIDGIWLWSEPTDEQKAIET